MPGLLTWRVISICEPLAPAAALSPTWNAVLHLKFDDIDTPNELRTTFSAGHAALILDFVEQASAENIDGILVHCHAGISRSAAVAKFIAEQHQLPFPERYSVYNRHVYRLLRCTAWVRSLSGSDDFSPWT